MRYAIAAFLSILLEVTAYGGIKVVTSTQDLAEFVRIVGGNKVIVDAIVRGPQNPHAIDVKPSYMMKLRTADAFVIVGMQLELWAPQIIDGSRNVTLHLIDCSRNIQKMEVPAFKVDASQGDVHPYGNPHYWLDPTNVRTILLELVEGLSTVSPGDRAYFADNAESYASALDKRILKWRTSVRSLKGKKIVTYHSSFSYFAQFLGLEVVGYVEPKPGIPPTPSHIRALTQTMRDGGVRVIGLEQYFEENSPLSVARSAGATVVRLSTSIGGLPGTETYEALIDFNIQALLNAFH